MVDTVSEPNDALTVELTSTHVEGAGRPSLSAPEPGCVLGSRYLLEEIIGRGGTSTVYRARDLRAPSSAGVTPSLVAVKLSVGTRSTDPLAAARLQREFHTMKGLFHAGIARVLALECDGDVCFMSMQLIAGQTLKSWMTSGGEHAAALRIIDTCSEALEYAHSMGIVHGDLKPTNVLVTENGSARLIDFGSSSIPGSRRIFGSDPAVAATPLYASPQILAGQRAEALDDVFSLACLSYSILSGGRHPYGGHPSFENLRAKSAPTYVPAIPAELFEVIKRGLSAEQGRRPASVSRFRQEFAAAEQRRRAGACRPDPAAFALVRKSSSRLRIFVVASAVAVAGAGVLYSAARSTQATRAETESSPATGAHGPIAPAVPPAASTPKTAAQASVPPLAPAPDLTPALSAQTAPLPHDSSSISFQAALVHVSAQQSLVAITVRRAPANRTPGAFVWRVERGNAMPAIDYERMTPQRVIFIEGQAVRTLFIPLLNSPDSHVPPGPRFFDVVLQPVAGGPALGRIARITVVIDPEPRVWVAIASPADGPGHPGVP